MVKGVFPSMKKLGRENFPNGNIPTPQSRLVTTSQYAEYGSSNEILRVVWRPRKSPRAKSVIPLFFN